MSILFTRLEVRDEAVLQSALEWYQECLGMTVIKEFAGYTWVGFADMPDSSVVEFTIAPEGSTKYEAQDTDLYWKIGLGLSDVNAARNRLQLKNVDVSEPCQFHEIGFLCHLKDPTGYCIELLQHHFQSNFSEEYASSQADPQRPLGQPAVIGQVTLRVANAERSLEFYRDHLGMTLVSKQNVPDKFDLYFLAACDDERPKEDIEAVENREWLWQRKYTTLELQHRIEETPCRENRGFRGIGVRVRSARFRDLEQCSPQSPCENKIYGETVLFLTDPDGAEVMVFSEL